MMSLDQSNNTHDSWSFKIHIINGDVIDDWYPLVVCSLSGFRAFTTAKDGTNCLAMEYGGEQSLNDLIEKRKEEGLQAFPAATIEQVALHLARGLQVKPWMLLSWMIHCDFHMLIVAPIQYLSVKKFCSKRDTNI